MANESPFADAMKTWMDAQKRMWDGFFEATQGYGKSPSTKSWEQLVSMGEETLKNTFQAQAGWIQTWVKSLTGVEGTPSQVLDSAKQFEDGYRRWSEAQQQIWANWFDLLKKFDPSSMTGGWPASFSNPFQVWQETTQKMVNAQFEWMRAWMDQVRK